MRLPRRSKKEWLQYGALMLFGGLLGQLFVAMARRSFEPSDFLANFAGYAGGVAIATLLMMRYRGTDQESDQP